MNDWLKETIVPLRLIFWGTLIVVIDFNINSFDLINDFIGMVMITAALGKLCRLPVSKLYHTEMFWNYVISFVATIIDFFGEIITLTIQPITISSFTILGFVSELVLLFCLWRCLSFCRCMEEICESKNLSRCSESWQYSRSLIAYGMIVPFISFFLFLYTTEILNIQNQVKEISIVLMFLVVGLFVWGIIHFLMSVSRMINAVSVGNPNDL
jgi:hypothetical protein